MIQLENNAGDMSATADDVKVLLGMDGSGIMLKVVSVMSSVTYVFSIMPQLVGVAVTLEMSERDVAPW